MAVLNRTAQTGGVTVQRPPYLKDDDHGPIIPFRAHGRVLVNRKAKQGFVLINEKLEVTQEIHTQ